MPVNNYLPVNPTEKPDSFVSHKPLSVIAKKHNLLTDLKRLLQCLLPDPGACFPATCFHASTSVLSTAFTSSVMRVVLRSSLQITMSWLFSRLNMYVTVKNMPKCCFSSMLHLRDYDFRSLVRLIPYHPAPIP